MPPLLIASPLSLSGKTAVAVALGWRFQDAGRSVALSRLAGDGNAAEDARLFSGLAFNVGRQAEPVEPAAAAADADVTLIEAPAGDPRGPAGSLSAKALVVVAYSDPLPADIPSYCQALGDSCSGVIITRVPSRRLEVTRAAAEAAGVRLVALVPEDRLLAAPSLATIAEALEVDSSFLNSARDEEGGHSLANYSTSVPVRGRSPGGCRVAPGPQPPARS